MDINSPKTTSQSLLLCGNGQGVCEKLLLKPKTTKALQTERVPRSSVLERLQTFLPQMAEANKKLIQQIAEAPAGHFDIENVKEAEKVIEMDVAVVELDESDDQSSEDEETSDSDDEDDDDDDDDGREIAEKNLKLP
ncbi:NOP protein chaperone 1, partial [Austrofundulus limnaeus]|uniref:NOP protein chaperone 1 n=1 Tax=Austrofundulus limnaeus TaxID=52670 RepID=A0A2I4CPR9_AUSLI